MLNYLICGNSYNLIEEEIDKIVKGRKCERYSLEEKPLKEIIEDLGYNSLFETGKILVLKDFESLTSSKKENERDIGDLQEYLKNPNPKTILIIVTGEKISTRGPLKDIVKNLNVIETPIITKPYELSKIFTEVLRKEGYSMSQNTLNVFSEKCASNYDIALNEFNKLRGIKQDNRLITEDDVLNYVSNYNTSDLFGFKDAVVNRDIKKASAMLDDLESSKMEIVPLVVMLAKEFQILYEIKSMVLKKLSNDRIGTELGNMHPYRVKLLREASSKYDQEKLEDIILYLCNLDLKLVSEDNLGFDELRKFLLML